MIWINARLPMPSVIALSGQIANGGGLLSTRELCHQAVLLPNLNVFSVNVLTRFFEGLLIVSALQWLRRLINLAVGINKVDEVGWHR